MAMPRAALMLVQSPPQRLCGRRIEVFDDGYLPNVANEDCIDRR
jgi:hypothetical protein